MHNQEHEISTTQGGPAGQETTRRVVGLMGEWSLEATMPKPGEIETVRSTVPAGSRFYLSALPHVGMETLIENARLVAAAGLEAVPHVAVRNFASQELMGRFLESLRKEAGVRRILAVAGDRGQPAGPFGSSLQLIESGLLQKAGIEAVEFAGYPDGHPKIMQHELASALEAKVAAARKGGLEMGLVTQFCFDAKTILSWLLRVRFDFPELPVRIGLAGPANAQTLVRYALRCGVKASARGLGRGLILLRNLKGESTPLRNVQAIAERCASERCTPVALHFYSFGGIAKTALWAQALAKNGTESVPPTNS